MQSDAQHLDADRQKRLAAIEAQDLADRQADDASRVKSARYGDKADFVGKMQRSAIDGMGLGERLERGGRKVALEGM